MNSSDTNRLIEKLNDRINWYVEHRDLFCGGCCYAAYLLAKGLEQTGINYSVVIYQGGSNWNTNRFRKVCSGNGCGHVAIRVVYKHRKIELGFHEHFNYLLERSLSRRGKWMKREYTTMSSKDLRKIYYENGWNRMWDTRCNGILAKEINRIFRNYM